MSVKSWGIAALSAAVLAFSSSVASAAPISLFQVTIDTSALAGGLYGLDFQLVDGAVVGGDGNSTITLSNFTFGGGSPAGGLTTFGGATGDFGSGATLTDTSFFNEFYQNFLAGSSLSFQLGVSLGDDVSADPLAFDDYFSMAIIDPFGPAEIPTFGPANAMITLQFGDEAPQAFGSDLRQTTLNVPAPEIQAVASAVPEPGSLVLLGIGLMGGAVAARRRRSKS